MSVINTKVQDAKARFQPKLRQWYKVIETRRGSFTFQNKPTPAIFVKLMTPEKEIGEYSIGIQDTATPNSRLGSHILALGNDDSKWAGQYVGFLSWGQDGYSLKAQKERPDIAKPFEAGSAEVAATEF